MIPLEPLSSRGLFLWVMVIFNIIIFVLYLFLLPGIIFIIAEELSENHRSQLFLIQFFSMNFLFTIFLLILNFFLVIILHSKLNNKISSMAIKIIFILFFVLTISTLVLKILYFATIHLIENNSTPFYGLLSEIINFADREFFLLSLVFNSISFQVLVMAIMAISWIILRRERRTPASES